MKKILLIENDQLLIDFYKEVFKIAGFNLEVLDWGYKAIKRLKEIQKGRKKKPDLILLDLILPDINGILILKEAREHPKTKGLKIFALTSFTDPELDKELIKEGIDKILVKIDYTPKQLIALVKRTLGLK